VFAFSLLIGLGATLGLGWIAWQSPGKNVLRYLDAGLWVLLGSLIGGRLVFVALTWPYFQTHPLETIQVWQGGFSGPGALAGGLLALVMVALITRQSLGLLAGALLPLAVTLTVSAWLACWQYGCGYGQPVSAWWGIPARDEWGTVVPRWPTHLVAALLAILSAWALERWLSPIHRTDPPPQDVEAGPWHLSRPGLASALWLLCTSLVLFTLSFLRADPIPTWQGLRLDAWAGIALAAISLLALLALAIQSILAKKYETHSRSGSN